MKAIGPNFAAELQAAGLQGLPFTWGPDGAISFSSAMTQAQQDAVLAVYGAHDPLTIPTEQTRLADIDAALATATFGGVTLAQLRAMTKDQFVAWYAANVTNNAQALIALKWTMWVVLRKL